jgi:hypothetical protein
MSTDEPRPGGRKILQGVNERIGIQENPVLKKLSGKDPTLRDFPRTRQPNTEKDQGPRSRNK